jgi:DNA processing protein
MSGVAMGTVVVEASSTSGAETRARLVLEHGKRLFLLDSLVKSEQWAQRLAEHSGVVVVRAVDDVIATLFEAPEQFVLHL